MALIIRVLACPCCPLKAIVGLVDIGVELGCDSEGPILEGQWELVTCEQCHGVCGRIRFIRAYAGASFDFGPRPASEKNF